MEYNCATPLKVYLAAQVKVFAESDSNSVAGSDITTIPVVASTVNPASAIGLLTQVKLVSLVGSSGKAAPLIAHLGERDMELGDRLPASSSSVIRLVASTQPTQPIASLISAKVIES